MPRQLTIAGTPVPGKRYVRWFSDVRLTDIAEVGGKNASSGELSAMLAADRGKVPEGFALTARAGVHVDQRRAIGRCLALAGFAHGRSSV